MIFLVEYCIHELTKQGVLSSEDFYCYLKQTNKHIY